MHKNNIKKIINLPAISVLVILLTGCASSNPFVVDQDKKRAESSATHILENTGLLRYSTTGYLEINDIKYDLNDLSKNVSYEDSGIGVKPIYGIDKKAIESIELTYPKEQGLPEIDMMPYNEYNTHSGRKVENYLREMSEIRDVTDKESTGFVIQNNATIITDLQNSLSEAIVDKIGTSSHTHDFRIELDEDGTIIVQGPSNENKQNLYYPNTPLDIAQGGFYYTYTDVINGGLIRVKISSPESPYYDVKQDKLITNWVFSEPEKITGEDN
jgi:hypothetical protein